MLISVVVICYDMQREAPRTLHSLSRSYQQGIEDLQYEVLVVDNGSSRPLSPEQVRQYGPEFSYSFFPADTPSPVKAINDAVSRCAGKYVVICIDGARILSPGMLRFMAMAVGLSTEPVVSSLAWHLGSSNQMVSVLEGYDQAVEDRLLDSVDWRSDGNLLYSIASLAGSSALGWFHPVSESNCVGLSRRMFDRIGGFDPVFVSEGGGYANLDFYKRVCEQADTQVIVLLGEGTFHQFHGGVSTNAMPEVHPRKRFAQEYRDLRGEAYFSPQSDPIYLGSLPTSARRFLMASLDP